MHSGGWEIAASHWQFCTFNRSSGHRPLLPSKAPKTHLNNFQYTPSVRCDLHIIYATDTCNYESKCQRTTFLGVVTQRCDQSDLTVLNVAVTTWSQHVDGVFWRFLERTERGKASAFLSYIGIVDDRLPPKKCSFPWRHHKQASGIIWVWEGAVTHLYTLNTDLINESHPHFRSLPASLIFISRSNLQIFTHLWLPGWLCLHHWRLAGPLRGHAGDEVVAVGRGAAAQAGWAVPGWQGRRLLLQRPQWQHGVAATQRGWGIGKPWNKHTCPLTPMIPT